MHTSTHYAVFKTRETTHCELRISAKECWFCYVCSVSAAVYIVQKLQPVVQILREVC